jgi:hypothetical protein
LEFIKVIFETWQDIDKTTRGGLGWEMFVNQLCLVRTGRYNERHNLFKIKMKRIEEAVEIKLTTSSIRHFTKAPYAFSQSTNQIPPARRSRKR